MEALLLFDPSLRAARERAYRRHTLLGLALSLVVVGAATQVMAYLHSIRTSELPEMSDAIYLVPYVEVVEVREVDEPPGGGSSASAPLPEAPPLVETEPALTEPPAVVPDLAGTPTPVAEAPATSAPLYPLPSAPPPGTFPGGSGPPGGNPGTGRGTGSGAGTDDGEGDGSGDPAPLVERPDRSPVPVRFSEPAYPPEARREGVRARVRIRVLVDERGRVEEARIVERVRLGRGDREEPAASLPHGMDEAALDAARRYQFRPAQADGRRVRSYTTITCSFGV